MKPLFDRILVKEIKVETTDSGIIIPDLAQQAKPLCRWEVIETGCDCKVLKKGDVILTHAFAGTNISELGKKEEILFRVMLEKDAIVVL